MRYAVTAPRQVVMPRRRMERRSGAPSTLRLIGPAAACSAVEGSSLGVTATAMAGNMSVSRLTSSS